MRARDYYSIEDRDGVKMVHYLGWYYPHDSYDSWVAVELNGAFMPLAEFVAGDRFDAISDMTEVSAQYYHYLSEEEAEKEQDEYFNGSPGTCLPFRKLTNNTPLGDYWTES